MAQTYLQLKMQSNKQLAITLTNSLRNIHANYMSTIEKGKPGAERLVNYSACLMPDEYYRSSCRDTWREDKRLVMALGEIYDRGDVTLDMVEIYFRKNLLPGARRAKSNSLVAHIQKKLLGQSSRTFVS